MATKNQFIIEIWERTGSDTVGASELGMIQRAMAERFGAGSEMSPASIARVLADHGVRLGHPEVLEADVRWRESHRLGLFAPEELSFDTLESANALIEKIERLGEQFQNGDSMFEYLQESVRLIKSELQLIAAGSENRELAQEVAQWLTVWLQNPQIFAEWLALRRATAEFRERFES